MSETVKRVGILVLGVAFGLVAGWILSRSTAARTEGAGRLDLAVIETLNSLEALALLQDPDPSALEAQLHRDLELALATSDRLLDRGFLPEEPLNMNQVMGRYAPVLRNRPDLRRRLEAVVARLAGTPWS